jgi:hypothetical protein
MEHSNFNALKSYPNLIKSLSQSALGQMLQNFIFVKFKLLRNNLESKHLQEVLELQEVNLIILFQYTGEIVNNNEMTMLIRN